MSYDVTLTTRTVDGVETVVFDRNHTSNTARMWREAGCDLAEFVGATAVELRDALAPAIAQMKADPGRFLAMEPANKWGSYESCREFLEDIYVACATHPSATVEVDW